MARLLIHVEGQTEETFVNEVLSEYLCARGYDSVSARLVGNSRMRGGIRAWESVKKGILNHLKEDVHCLATTMVDYYALPQSGGKAWPGRATAGRLPFANKAAHVENALFADVEGELDARFNPRRFVPFVIMHEFEGLLFSDCDAFGQGIYRPALSPAFQEIRDQFTTPEEINDSPLTAPSKRIEKLIPGYEKPIHGSLAILEIGLDKIQQECPHFRAWLERLVALAG